LGRIPPTRERASDAGAGESGSLLRCTFNARLARQPRMTCAGGLSRVVFVVRVCKRTFYTSVDSSAQLHPHGRNRRGLGAPALVYRGPAGWQTFSRTRADFKISRRPRLPRCLDTVRRSAEAWRAARLPFLSPQAAAPGALAGLDAFLPGGLTGHRTDGGTTSNTFTVVGISRGRRVPPVIRGGEPLDFEERPWGGRGDAGGIQRQRV